MENILENFKVNSLKEYGLLLESQVRNGQITEAMATSKFSSFLSKGVQGLMTEGYDMYPKFYLEGNITTQANSDQDPQLYVDAGLPTGVEVVQEGAEFPIKSGVPEEHVYVKHWKKGLIAEITYELVRLDQSKTLQDRARNLGKAHALYENSQIAAFYNDGASTTAYDGVVIFSTSGRPFSTGGANVAAQTNNGGLGALSSSNLSTAKQEIALWKGYSGETIVIIPEILLCATDQLETAQQLIDSEAYVSATYSSKVKNVHYQSLKIVTHPELDSGTWYLINNISGLVMSWIDKLTLAQEAENTGLSFRNHIFAYRAHTWWGINCLQTRWAYKGN